MWNTNLLFAYLILQLHYCGCVGVPIDGSDDGRDVAETLVRLVFLRLDRLRVNLCKSLAILVIDV